MSENFPKIGYIVHWPSRRIVRVKVSKTRDFEKVGGYPLYVESLEPTVDIGESVVFCNSGQVKGNGFYIAGLSVITLYRSRKQAEKIELEKLYREYATERRALRRAQKKYKWALKTLAEYKKFKQLQTPHFIQ